MNDRIYDTKPLPLVSNADFIHVLKTISLPVALQNLLFISLNFVDTFMVATLGKKQFSGVGLGGQYYFMLNLAVVGVVMGHQIFLAQYWGSGNRTKFLQTMGQSIVCSLGLAILFAIPAIFFPETILGLFSSDYDVIIHGSDYLRILSIQMIIFPLTFTLATASRATKNAKLPLKISVVTFSTNTLLNYLLIQGNFGFPALGVRGAAVATAFASLLSLILYVTVIVVKDNPLQAPLKVIFKPSLTLFKQVQKKGIFVLLHEIFWSLGLTLFVTVFSRTSTDAYAAYQIAIQFFKMLFIVSSGLSAGISVTLGTELGKGNIEAAKQYKSKFLKLLFFSSITFAAFIVLIGSLTVSSLFSKVGGDIQSMAISMLIVLAIFAPFSFYNGIQATGITRAGGDTFWPVLFEVGGVYLWEIPVLLLCLQVLHFNAPLAIACASAGKIIVAYLMYRRTKTNLWAKNLVRE